VRDQAWLHGLLDATWDAYFADVPQENDVRIEFGRRAKRRLGSIRLDPNDRQTSIITINGLFKLEDIPGFVVQATIFHELSHYAHGFNSPLAQRYHQPHAGGVMRREYDERGALDLYQQQKRWLKDNWLATIQRELPPATTRRGPASSQKVPKPFWFRRQG